MIPPLAAYGSLFFASLLAATLFPTQSEAILSGLLLTKSYSTWLLVFVASIGNTLGSIINWAIGREIEKFHGQAWFPFKLTTLARAKAWYQNHGRWLLLLSWVPFIGDPLTVAAGIMKEKLSIFIAIVAAAKTARYIALVFIIGQ